MLERSLDRASTKDIPGFTKLKAGFEAANTQLVELHYICEEVYFEIA